MTEEKKQELSQLLDQAMANLEIRRGFGEPLEMPEDIYRRYVKESWKYRGLDQFSPFWILLSPDLKNATIKSYLLHFIRQELAPFIDGDKILISYYFIESNSTDGPRARRFDSQNINLDLILERLLDIAIVRGVKEAVAVFDTCSRPEGSRGLFQEVSVVEGLTLEKDVELFRGIRLVPLLDSGVSEEVIRCIPSFPAFAFFYEFPNFFGHTLLVIDRPGLSVFQKPSLIQEQGGDLPFQIEVPDVKFPNRSEVCSFRETLGQTLSLVLDFPINIPRGDYRFEEDRVSNSHEPTFAIQPNRVGFYLDELNNFNPRHGTIASLIHANLFRCSTLADESHIQKARCLYDVLESKPEVRKKLRIPIDRWIKTKSSGNVHDKFIDVGIALEALYVPNPGTRGKGKQIRQNASEYLTTDADRKEKLVKVFRAIYDYRSDVVHNKVSGEKVSIGEKCVHVSDLVVCAQNLCLKSIKKIIEEGKFPELSALGKKAHRNKAESE